MKTEQEMRRSLACDYITHIWQDLKNVNITVEEREKKLELRRRMNSLEKFNIFEDEF